MADLEKRRRGAAQARPTSGRDLLEYLESVSGEPIERNRRGATYVLLDCSTSMIEADKLAKAKLGVLDYAERACTRGYSVGVICFGTEARCLQKATQNTASLNEKIEEMVAKGSTNMEAAIELGAALLRNSKLEKVLCIVTDGMPDSQERTLLAARKAESLGIRIMAVGTDDADKKFLKRLVTQEGWSAKVDKKRMREAISEMSKLLPAPVNKLPAR